MTPADGNDKNEAPVVIRDLHKTFGDQTVLNGIDLTVAPGENLAVLGRSGTGKSVLLKLIIGLQKPDSGSIRIHGQEITDLNMDQLNEIRKKVGFLFQQAALYDSLTVEENVAFPLDRHTKMSAAERKDKVRELLSSVGMDQHLEKLPSEISGGMQKRVGLARALALEPDIILFDEPTAGLDPITAAEIDELIVQLKERRKITSVVVTHDIRGAKAFSDRVALMNEGNIVAQGTFQELQQNKDDFVVRFLKNGAGSSSCSRE
jgi:phospholipid/cholesterol/gamma-HCH transport system ATP-binding protein